MNSNLWAKTILTVYRYLERISDAIDGLVNRQALNSYYSNFTNHTVMDIADKIIELGERKVKLINIKVLVDDILAQMDKLSAQLLIEKYIFNIKREDIAKKHDLPMRSYYRKVAKAEDSFTGAMAQKGFGEKKLAKYLKSENWIAEVYKKYQLEEEKIFSIEMSQECAV